MLLRPPSSAAGVGTLFGVPVKQSFCPRNAVIVSSSAMAPTATPLSTSGAAFIRPHLRDLAPYTPIEPFEILSARLGRLPKDIVKLDANENPYGPPPEELMRSVRSDGSLVITMRDEGDQVLEALGSMEFPNIYPDPESRRLRAALAKDTGLEAEHILVGCGADELIDLIMRCTLDPGDQIVDCPPTFTMYAFDAAVNGASVVKVPRLPGFALDVPGIVEAVQHHKPKLVFLTSPNNPDGCLVTDEELETILKLPVLVILDEAYVEFALEPSRMQWVTKYENLVVLRTFSKRAGLAGLRVGYGGFPLSLIEYLWRAKQPYNVSVAAEVAACAALTNQTYLEAARVEVDALTCQLPARTIAFALCSHLVSRLSSLNGSTGEDVKNALVKERERLFVKLKEIPFLEPYPSHANFILCSVSGSKSAKQLKADLAKEGVMVRQYEKPDLKNYIRISVGKPEQTDALLSALGKVS